MIQQPEGLEGLGRFGFILAKHGLWLAAGIFLRIQGGVGRLREKTELSKYAAASGAGMGWGDARRDGTARSGGAAGGGRHATTMAMGTATGAQPGPTGGG